MWGAGGGGLGVRNRRVGGVGRRGGRGSHGTPTHPPTPLLQAAWGEAGGGQQAAGPLGEASRRVGSGGWGRGRVESTCKGGGEAGGEADLAVFLPSQRFTLEKFCDINTSQGTKRE